MHLLVQFANYENKLNTYSSRQRQMTETERASESYFC